MNPFRSLARSIWNAVDFRKKSAEAEGKPPEVTPKKEVLARPVFRPSARGDGFDAVPRTAPVDLTGGVKLKFEVLEESKPVIPPAQSDFVASLDDLGLLIDELPPPPDPESIAPWEQPSVEPVDVFEYAAPVARPLDFFEEAPPAIAADPQTPIVPSGVEGLLVDSPPGAQPAVTPAPADEVPLDSARGERELLPVSDQPPAAAVAQQAQFTVDLLMPVGPGSTVQRKPVEEFSTLELLDTVEQLSVVAPAADEAAVAPVDQLAVETPKP